MAVDAKRSEKDSGKFEVFSHGGRTATGLDARSWIQEVVERGAGEILQTSMDKDGTLDGFDLEMLRALGKECNVPLIASGGVGNLEHLVEGVTQGGADAVLAASIFHFGDHTIPEAKKHMQEAGISVRPHR